MFIGFPHHHHLLEPFSIAGEQPLVRLTTQIDSPCRDLPFENQPLPLPCLRSPLATCTFPVVFQPYWLESALMTSPTSAAFLSLSSHFQPAGLRTSLVTATITLSGFRTRPVVVCAVLSLAFFGDGPICLCSCLPTCVYVCQPKPCSPPANLFVCPCLCPHPPSQAQPSLAS